MIMVKDSQYVKQSFFIDNGQPNLQKVFFLWEDGFTFYARDLAKLISPLKSLTDNLEKELFPLKVETNVFLTPGGRTGFLPHFDCHDVFVIQLRGEKHWKFWPAFKQDMDYGAPTDADQKHVDQIIAVEAPIFERTLAAGDVLYIPRGAIHGPTSVSFSSHLTFWLKSPLAESVTDGSVDSFFQANYEYF